MIHRIGMLLPATNIAVEIELNRVLPKNYQLFISRVKVSSVDEIGWKEHDADINYQAELIGTIKPEVVILLQTAASLYGPENYDADIVQRITKFSGAPAVTTAHSIGRALRAIGAKNVAMLSPYNSNLATNAKAYFQKIHGIEISSVDFFNLTDVKKIIELGPEPAEKAIEKLAATKPDAIILAGGAYQIMEHIDAWEKKYDCTIVSTNQAAIWAAIQACQGNEKILGRGKLLELMPKG
jgi:maleate cis-trans isomerase